MATSFSIYNKGLVTRRIALHITEIGSTLQQTLEQYVARFAGCCATEGYIQSTKMLTHSIGTVSGDDRVLYDVAIECQICFPVEGQLIQCKAISITKAGVRGEHATEVPSPVDVFIARDFNHLNPLFAAIKEGDTFMCRVVGHRFELNDEKIRVVGEVVSQR
jgi:hypothetical protein